MNINYMYSYYLKTKSIQLRTCKYILWCSVTNCDKPVHVDLGLKTLRNRRDFCKLNALVSFYKVMSMNDGRLPFKLLTNE